jgi:hypothetical protein
MYCPGALIPARYCPSKRGRLLNTKHMKGLQTPSQSPSSKGTHKNVNKTLPDELQGRVLDILGESIVIVVILWCHGPRVPDLQSGQPNSRHLLLNGPGGFPGYVMSVEPESMDE